MYRWHGYGQSRGHGRIPSDLRGQGYGPEGPSYRREENPAGYLSRELNKLTTSSQSSLHVELLIVLIKQGNKRGRA